VFIWFDGMRTCAAAECRAIMEVYAKRNMTRATTADEKIRAHEPRRVPEDVVSWESLASRRGFLSNVFQGHLRLGRWVGHRSGAIAEMAKVMRLSRLFGAIAKRDWDHTMELARSIAADEERIGHRSAAQTLRGALNPNGVNGARPQPETYTVPNHATLLMTALTEVDRDVSLQDVVIRAKYRESLKEVVSEWQKREYLHQLGLPRRSKLIFYGPPGCGKSLTARALGRELGLPTYVVRFDAVIGAYLGQTAIHLRELFRFAEQAPSVLVFDEVDALGKKRGSPLDVGELDRIVISMMQELEHCRCQGLIIATSNMPTNLDNALWRRFDLSVEFPKPTKSQLRAYVPRLARAANIRLSSSTRKLALAAPSFADAENAVQAAARRIALRKH